MAWGLNFTPNFSSPTSFNHANLHALPSSVGLHGERLVTSTAPAAERLNGDDVAVHDSDDGLDHDAVYSNLTWNDGRPFALAPAP